MKIHELKRIRAGSVFKFNLCVGFVFSLIVGAVLLLMGYGLQDLGLELGTLEGVLGIGTGVLGLILASALGGLVLGAIGAIAAFFYNLFAAAVGGIGIGLDDDS